MIAERVKVRTVIDGGFNHWILHLECGHNHYVTARRRPNWLFVRCQKCVEKLEKLNRAADSDGGLQPRESDEAGATGNDPTL
jgi:hypothetical protein